MSVSVLNTKHEVGLEHSEAVMKSSRYIDLDFIIIRHY